MNKISLIAAIVFAIVFLSSCGSVKMGRDFEVGGFASKIEQRVTTQTWFAPLKILQIKFDRQGKVRSYYWKASRQ